MVVENLRYGRHRDELAAGQEIDSSNYIHAFGATRAKPADFRTIIGIGHHTAVFRMHSGRQGCAVDLCGADISGVMIAKKDAVLREAVKHGTVLGCDEIRPHSVPDDQDNMLSRAFGGSLPHIDHQTEGNESQIEQAGK